MGIEVDGKVFETDEEGYLADITQWVPGVAEVMAKEDDLELTDEHWDIINFLREYYEEYQIAPAVPRFSSHYLDFSSKRGVGWYGHTLKISPTGVMGDPTRASAEKGRRMWDVIVANLVEMIEDIKELSLEDIHQRRY